MKKFIIFLLILMFLIALSGCSNKPLVKVETQEIYIPVKCNLELPKKPKDDGSFKSHKEIAIYYKEVENIARICTKQD